MNDPEGFTPGRLSCLRKNSNYRDVRKKYVGSKISSHYYLELKKKKKEFS